MRRRYPAHRLVQRDRGGFGRSRAQIHVQTRLVRPACRSRGRTIGAGRPAVLAGDYNVVPTDFDIYAMRPYGQGAAAAGTRAAHAKLLAAGWTDALRALYPGDPMSTFWSYLRNRWPRGCRPQAQSPPPQPGDRAAVKVRRWRSRSERPCAFLDRTKLTSTGHPEAEVRFL